MRLGSNADVNPSGSFGFRSRLPVRSNGGEIDGPTVLLTVAKLSRLKRLNASNISSADRLSDRSLIRRARRKSHVQKFGPRPVLRPAKGGRSLVGWRSPLISDPASRLKGRPLLARNTGVITKSANTRDSALLPDPPCQGL